MTTMSQLKAQSIAGELSERILAFIVETSLGKDYSLPTNLEIPNIDESDVNYPRE